MSGLWGCMKCNDEKAMGERCTLAGSLTCRLCDGCRAEFDRFYWTDPDFIAVAMAINLNALELDRVIKTKDMEAQAACLAVHAQGRRDLIALCDKWLVADTKETK